LGSAEIVIPVLSQNRDDIRREYRLQNRVRIGLAGGIGTPYAVASAFVKGVDFVMSGSINQCTVESGQSDLVKSMLAKMDIHDTDYIPTDELLNSKTKVQILKKGVFFPAKAARLHEIFRTQESLSSMPVRLKDEVEKKYLKKSFAEVLGEIVEHGTPAGLDSLEESPTYELGLILRWYYNRSIELALNGAQADAVDFNVHTSGAMGACNQWLRNTPYEAWRSRHAEEMGARLMQEAEQMVQGTLGRLKLQYSA
jgi:trans-AT polyketide synthase/acyltransferase/oxidoreductase domain-containing protein